MRQRSGRGGPHGPPLRSGGRKADGLARRVASPACGGRYPKGGWGARRTALVTWRVAQAALAGRAALGVTYLLAPFHCPNAAMPFSTETVGSAVVTDAHLWGAVGGLLYVAAERLYQRRRSNPSSLALKE